MRTLYLRIFDWLAFFWNPIDIDFIFGLCMQKLIFCELFIWDVSLRSIMKKCKGGEGLYYISHSSFDQCFSRERLEHRLFIKLKCLQEIEWGKGWCFLNERKILRKTISSTLSIIPVSLIQKSLTRKKTSASNA